MGESVTLSWPFHTKTLLEGIWNLLHEKYFTDFQLRANFSTSNGDDSCIKVHHLILAVFSPNVIKKCDSNHFHLPNFDFELDKEVLGLLVDFIYRGRVSIAEVKLKKLKTLAESLGIKAIADLIDSYYLNKKLKEEKERIEIDLKSSRGARKRKGHPFKVFKRVKKSAITIRHITIMNESKLIENTDAEACEDIMRVSGQVADEESSVMNSEGDAGVDACREGSDYSENKNNFTGKISPSLDQSEKLKCNVWKNKSFERLRPRACVSKKKKRKTETGKMSTAFDKVRKQYVCKFCDKGFSTKDRHVRHVRCHENPDNLQKCLHCDYKTVEKYVLVQHLASKHHVDRDGNPLTRDIKCSDCSFTCVSNFQLKNHKLQKHSSKQFKCEECGNMFGKKALRDRHILAKHRNERPYMCETCGHRAKTLNAFKSHLELHSGKKFICDICGLALTLSCSLKRHMKLHTSNEKPFPCHLCSFATRKRYNLRVHLRNVHKLEMDSMGNVDDKHIIQSNLVSPTVPTMVMSSEKQQNVDSTPCLSGFIRESMNIF